MSAHRKWGVAPRRVLRLLAGDESAAQPQPIVERVDVARVIIDVRVVDDDGRADPGAGAGRLRGSHRRRAGPGRIGTLGRGRCRERRSVRRAHRVDGDLRLSRTGRPRPVDRLRRAEEPGAQPGAGIAAPADAQRPAAGAGRAGGSGRRRVVRLPPEDLAGLHRRPRPRPNRARGRDHVPPPARPRAGGRTVVAGDAQPGRGAARVGDPGGIAAAGRSPRAVARRQVGGPDRLRLRGSPGSAGNGGGESRRPLRRGAGRRSRRRAPRSSRSTSRRRTITPSSTGCRRWRRTRAGSTCARTCGRRGARSIGLPAPSPAGTCSSPNGRMSSRASIPSRSTWATSMGRCWLAAPTWHGRKGGVRTELCAAAFQNRRITRP